MRSYKVLTNRCGEKINYKCALDAKKNYCNRVLLTLRLFRGGNEILVENALLITKVEEKVCTH